MTMKASDGRDTETSDPGAVATEAVPAEAAAQGSDCSGDAEPHAAGPSESEAKEVHAESKIRSRSVSFSLRSLTAGVVMVPLAVVKVVQRKEVPIEYVDLFLCIELQGWLDYLQHVKISDATSTVS